MGGEAIYRVGPGAPDGHEALLLARENPPDLVRLDWMIEGLSGIEVCRRLRRMPDTANVPIIMLTARGEEEDRVRGLETGADDYVTKPVKPKVLVFPPQFCTSAIVFLVAVLCCSLIPCVPFGLVSEMRLL